MTGGKKSKKPATFLGSYEELLWCHGAIFCHDSVGHSRSACWVLPRLFGELPSVKLPEGKTIHLWVQVPSPLIYSHILISIIFTPMGEFRSWLLLPPFHLSGIIPIQMYRVFRPPIFSKFFFSVIFQAFPAFRPFPPCSASKHPAAGKEHSGGLWLTNLCSQKCLLGDGESPNMAGEWFPLWLLFSKNRGTPK